MLASCSRDGSIILSEWRAVGIIHHRTLLEHGAPVWAIAFNFDGTKLASLGDDRSIRIWDVRSGTQLLRLRTDSKSQEAPNGRVLFHPDGAHVLSADLDGQLRVWRLEYGPAPRHLNGHEKSVNAVVFARSGSVVSGSADGTIRIWDALSESAPQTLTNGGNVSDLAFSHDGQTLAATSGYSDEDSNRFRGGSIDLYDSTHVYAATTLVEQEDGFACVAIDPRDALLAAGTGKWDEEAEDYVEGAVLLYDLRSKQLITTLRGHAQRIIAVSFHPKESLLATIDAMGSEVRFWDLKTKRPAGSLPTADEVQTIAFSQDGRWLVTGGHLVTVWDWKSRTIQHRLRTNDFITRLAFSNDGKTLATACQDRSIYLWDVATGQHRATLVGHSRPATSVAFSWDGNFLATGSADGTVLVHRAAAAPKADEKASTPESSGSSP